VQINLKLSSKNRNEWRHARKRRKDTKFECNPKNAASWQRKFLAYAVMSKFKDILEGVRDEAYWEKRLVKKVKNNR
jgi:hypothetical protein